MEGYFIAGFINRIRIDLELRCQILKQFKIVLGSNTFSTYGASIGPEIVKFKIVLFILGKDSSRGTAHIP